MYIAHCTRMLKKLAIEVWAVKKQTTQQIRFHDNSLDCIQYIQDVFRIWNISEMHEMNEIKWSQLLVATSNRMEKKKIQMKNVGARIVRRKYSEFSIRKRKTMYWSETTKKPNKGKRKMEKEFQTTTTTTETKTIIK